MGPIAVALVNDFPLVVAGLRAMLSPHDGRVAVVDPAVGSPGATRADLALLDPFGSEDVAERVHDVVAGQVADGVVVFSWQSSAVVNEAAAGAGALGFISKRLPPEQMVTAIEDVYWSMPGHRPRPSRPSSADDQEAARPGQADGLAEREAEVLALITQGLRNEEIAATLYLSINSIKRYIRSTYRKIGVTSRTEALLWALDHGFSYERPVPHR